MNPVVIITCVHYLGPPGPSPSQILGTFSRFSETFLAERGGVPRGSSRTLGDPPWGLSLCQESLREPREGPENLGSRRYWRSEIMNASSNDYCVCVTILSDQLASLSTGLEAKSRLLEAKSRGSRSLEAWKNLGFF